MLHPLYSKVLLESISSVDHIVTFKGDSLLNVIRFDKISIQLARYDQ